MSSKNSQHIIVKDETILAFYRENPSLDFITINHVFIDILKKLSTNLTETLSNSVNSKILSTLSEMSESISTIKQDMSKLNTELITNISLRLHESKKEYFDAIQLSLSNNVLSISDKFGSMLEKQNDALIVKTTSIINDIVPKSNETNHAKIESIIQTLSAAIATNSEQLLESIKENTPEQSMKEYTENIEAQFNKLVNNLQQPILSGIQLSEERTSNNIRDIREKINTNQAAQESLSHELNGFLNKYKHNSSTKGNISEIELFSILQQIFPIDEVIDSRSETASGDYIVKRLYLNKPVIMFENKDYTRSVSTDEVAKFERDIAKHKCHGVFLSQNSNITYKENFQIDVRNGSILVYIPNAQYNSDKIRIAVDTIDHLSQKLDLFKQQTENTEGIHISKDDFDELVEEYAVFSQKKAQIIESIRMSTKQTIDRLDEFQLVAIKKILTRNGIINTDDEHKCRFCSFIGKSKASLSAHVRGCKSNPNRTNTANGRISGVDTPEVLPVPS